MASVPEVLIVVGLAVAAVGGCVYVYYRFFRR